MFVIDKDKDWRIYEKKIETGRTAANLPKVSGALLEGYDYVLAGVKYGISQGMAEEIWTADRIGIEVLNADILSS